MLRPTVRNRAGLFLLTLLFLSGCGDELHPGTGFVRFEDGQPVQSGSVELRSTASGDRYSGRIDAHGWFQLTDADGREQIPPGDYEAVVVQIVLTEDLALDEHTHGTTVPRRYADYYTSGLGTTVRQGDEEPIELFLSPE